MYEKELILRPAVNSRRRGDVPDPCVHQGFCTGRGWAVFAGPGWEVLVTKRSLEEWEATEGLGEARGKQGSGGGGGVLWAAAGGYQERLALGRAAVPSAVEELERRMKASATGGAGKTGGAGESGGAAAASHAPAAAAPTGAGKKAIKRPAAAAPAGAAVKRPAGAMTAAVTEIVQSVISGIDIMTKPNGEPTTRKFCTDKAYGQGEARARKKDTRPSLLFFFGTSAKFAPRPPPLLFPGDQCEIRTTRPPARWHRFVAVRRSHPQR